MTDHAPHLSLHAVRKAYGQTLAVAGVSLSVAKGECIALLGPSGCGKTTTLRMVAGFLTPDSGRITLAGRDITRDPPNRRNIGMVFQAYALFPHLSVAGNVGFGLEMRGVPRAEAARRVGAALEMVGLSALADRYPSQLSGGQQQRVALARALVIEPDLLLLDEPLSNLDAGLRAEMRAEIASLRRRLGITTLFVTHDQHEAMALADRIAVMSSGRIVEIGPPKALSEAPRHVFTASFLGERNVVAGRCVGGAFRADGLPPLPGAPAGATHLVLRAARLMLGLVPDAVFRLDGTITGAAFLDDILSYEVAAGPLRLSVLRPSTEPFLPIGAAVTVSAPGNALSWIIEPAQGAAA
ncbi:MAG: ABC transporter ATP-binding protein [Acetobacteraceae bacterium]|nr:ABC transporter ATP-binding protein [Acetobacteraceae bacterium]MDW8398151.1 ABC transporter ATP-binding protein [Acetobacteraceae bacterium]